MSEEPQALSPTSSDSSVPTIQILPQKGLIQDDDIDVRIRTHHSLDTPLTSPNSPSLSSTLSTPSSEQYHPNLILQSEVPLSHMRVVRNREEILSPCVSAGRHFHSSALGGSTGSGRSGGVVGGDGAFGSSTSLSSLLDSEETSPTDIMSYTHVQPTVVQPSSFIHNHTDNDIGIDTNNNNNNNNTNNSATTSLEEAAEELLHTLENTCKSGPVSLEVAINTFIEQETTRRRSTVDKEDIALLQEIAAASHLSSLNNSTNTTTTSMGQEDNIETSLSEQQHNSPVRRLTIDSIVDNSSSFVSTSDALDDNSLLTSTTSGDGEEVKNNESSTASSLSSETTNKPHRFMQKRPSFINPELMSMLFSSLLSLQDLKPSDNQVAGHGQKDGEEHLVVRHLRDKIYKPINTKSKRAFDEVKFYEQQAPKIPLLAPFLPKYHGVQTVKENDQQFLVLEDLSAPFTNPCLLDIRMGRRVYGDDASLEKIKMFEEKYIYQKELGFGFSGMKVYNTDPEFSKNNKDRCITHKDQKFKVYDRYWGRSCKPGEESTAALDAFFFDTSYVDSELVGIKTVKSILSQLKQLEELFTTHQLIFRVYSSSLFLVFDADKAIVRMIDFAHVHENKEPSIDENYLYGISNLIQYIEEVLRRHNKDCL